MQEQNTDKAIPDTPDLSNEIGLWLCIASRWFVIHYADHQGILCSIYFVLKICSPLVPYNSLSQSNVIKWMSVRNTGLLSQHYQTNRDAAVGIIFLFNFPENIMSYSQNSMLCDLPAWSSINLQLWHHSMPLHSTSACDKTKNKTNKPVPLPEKTPQPKQKEATFGIYSLTIAFYTEQKLNKDLRSSITDKVFKANEASQSWFFCCSSFLPELTTLKPNKEKHFWNWASLFTFKWNICNTGTSM